MTERADNPLGTTGFSFVEFAARASDGLEALFERLGFMCVGRRGGVALFRQGGVSLLLNTEAEGPAAAFRAAHGPGVFALGFAVEDSARALAAAVVRGATVRDAGAQGLGAIASVGDTVIYLVDPADEAALWARFGAGEGAEAVAGVSAIDHVAYNLTRGEIERWSAFFADVLGFSPVRYFHIAGKQTGFQLRAMASPCGNIRIPLNESRDGRSQIEEFVVAFKGAGVQHIGFAVADIHASVSALRARGVAFQPTAEEYYAALPARVGGHTEDIAQLQRNGVLLDGDAESGLLLQIFSVNAVGPMFFELIQRKGNQGFGEGNVTALFESIEADQLRRGALDA